MVHFEKYKVKRRLVISDTIQELSCHSYSFDAIQEIQILVFIIFLSPYTEGQNRLERPRILSGRLEQGVLQLSLVL
jgi:hypothetical protein